MIVPNPMAAITRANGEHLESPSDVIPSRGRWRRAG